MKLGHISTESSFDMAEMKPEDASRYKEMAEKHADFLCDKVFKPAFIMAFLHGAKHAKEEFERTEKEQ